MRSLRSVLATASAAPLIAATVALAPGRGAAQTLPAAPAASLGTGALESLVVRLAAMTAVTGYEDEAADSLRALLPDSRRDRAGNVIWARGSGAPVRVAVCPLDEVGYVVGGITTEGYLTLRRVGGTPMGPLFDQWLEGQRVTVFGRSGAVPGVVLVRSTHLQRGRAAGPDEPFGLDAAYVDVGAASPADVEALGIHLLAPLARTKQPQRYGEGLLAAPFAAQRASCAALVAAVRRLPGSVRGTAVAVFAVRRHFAHDGAAFALAELARGLPAEQAVLLGGAMTSDSLGIGRLGIGRDSVVTGWGIQPMAAWSLPARYARSPVETVATADVAALVERLAAFLAGGR
jgi:putative aminopeptidase FrvX